MMQSQTRLDSCRAAFGGQKRRSTARSPDASRAPAGFILPEQSAEWPAAQTGGDPKIRIQREPAIAFGLGHRHQMIFPPRFL